MSHQDGGVCCHCPHQGQGMGRWGRVFRGPDALQSWRGERVCEVSALHSMCGL